MTKDASILKEIAAYYTDKINQYGDTPKGVDWNGEESQFIRFDQLSKIIKKDKFALNDLGCGYGAYFHYLQLMQCEFTYRGYDISEVMIDTAIKKYGENNNANFKLSSSPDNIANYTVASGIFNVRLEHDDLSWYEFMENMLDVMDKSCSDGFAFNCLTSYSDEDKKRDYLYYTDPCKIFDLCKKKYSRNISVLHDYDLYEFTVLVRKENV
jgi:SAM-dependent methyltransferase